MRIGALAHTLAKTYLHLPTRRRTHFLRGASGIGKTEVVYQMADILGKHVEGWTGVVDIRLSQFDPVDFRGIPFKNENDRTVWAIPAMWPEPGTSGLVFLDEITSALPAVQTTAYQLCNERRIGDYFLPEGWMVVAAGNRQGDRGVTYNLAGPLMNRLTVLDVDTTFDDWQDYAAMKGKRPEVIAAVKSRIDLLHKFDNKTGVIEQFPTPRGWFAVSDIMDADYDPKVRAELFNGALGKEAGSFFESYLRTYEKIPDLEKIERDPDSVEVPEDLDIRYRLAMGLSARLSGKNFEPVWKFLQRMPRELQTLTVKLAYRRDKTISDCTAFGSWAAANSDAFKRS